MKISSEHHDGFVVVRVEETVLDVGKAAELKRVLIESVGRQGLVLLVELSAVREIDSSGLGALVAVLKAVRMFGGTVRLCGVQKLVRDVMELTMIDRVLPLHGSVEEAMNIGLRTDCGD